MSIPEGGGHQRNIHERGGSLGFLLRTQPPTGASTKSAIVVQVPSESLPATETERSVCGLKAFLIDERREFPVPGEDPSARVVIDCAKVAALDIVDSPVHVHRETLETYHVLDGRGRMILGDRVESVGPGTYIVIPPGVRHGLASVDPSRPVRVLMTFTPGLAPVSHPGFRDEQILHPSTQAFPG